MEAVDPFVPSFEPENHGFGDIPQEWTTPFMPADTQESESAGEAPAMPVDFTNPFTVVPAPESESAATAEPVTEESAPEQPTPSFDTPAPESAAPISPFTFSGGAVAQAKSHADKLGESLADLHRTLEDTARERESFLRERSEMQDRIRALEAEAARKEEFKSLLQSGAGATLSVDDLQNLQGMTDALTQDPDRLTLLFSVVQQAPKLAVAINVYNQLRQLAERS